MCSYLCLIVILSDSVYMNASVKVKHKNYDDEYKNINSELAVRTAEDYCERVSTGELCISRIHVEQNICRSEHKFKMRYIYIYIYITIFSLLLYFVYLFVNITMHNFYVYIFLFVKNGNIT